MVAVLIVIALLCLYKIKFAYKNGFADYMSPQKTCSVKGIFVLLIPFCHMRQYIGFNISLAANSIYLEFLHQLGQLVVVMFLFYSGYGVMQSLEKKPGYVKTIPKRRVLKVLIHFDMAVCLYILLQALLGKTFGFKQILLSLLAWENVGNDSWFIFSILVIYCITFLVFLLAGKHRAAGTAAVTLLVAAFAVALYFAKGKSSYWWYDTAICYPVGMWYSLAKPKIDKALLPSFGKWLAACAALFAAFITLHILGNGPCADSRAAFLFEAPVFAVAVSVAAMRISADNAVLRWSGSRVFSVYILQRIPMITLLHFGFGNYPYAYAAISFFATLALAEIFDRFTAKTDKLMRL